MENKEAKVKQFHLKDSEYGRSSPDIKEEKSPE